MITLLLRATRAPSLLAGAMPAIVIPALLAWQGHEVHLGHALLVLLGLVSLQAGVNVVNDLFDDESGLDADPEFADNPFPLGSRVLQTGALSRKGMAALALACFGTGLVCGLWLDTVHPGHVVWWFGLAGAAFGYFYTAPPLKLAYHGVGEPIIFALFGPLAGLGTAYVQTGQLGDPAVILMSCVLGLVITAVLYLHHFPQHAADARHGKKTPIVRLGPVAAGKLVAPLLAVPFLLIGFGIWRGWLPLAALAYFAGAPFAFRSAATAWSAALDAKQMTGAFQGVMGSLVLGGTALAIALGIAA